MLFAAVFDDLWANIIAGALALALGWFWGRWRAMRIWKSKEFKDRAVLA